jgi:hypothetical protein
MTKSMIMKINYSHFLILTIVFHVFTLLSVPALLSAQSPVDYHFHLPAESGMWDIKADFGAVGDGITDDTDAFKQAFFGDESNGYRALYIPEGTYLISEPLVLEDKKKVVIGAGKSRTIIKLADNATGFDDPANPVRFIDAKGSQHSAQNFFMQIKHLTIEIGAGNPGATALFFHTNNTGTVYDVEIRSTDPAGAGWCGLELNSWPGPGLIKFVTIDGFDYGVRVTTDQYSMTFEHVVIKNARVVGFYNNDNTCSMRKVSIQNTPLALQNTGPQSMMSLIECDFSGNGESAIINENDGLMIVRDLITTGFEKAVTSFDQTVEETSIEEWHSHSPKFLFPSKKTSLRLPIEEVPQMQYPTPEDSFMVLRDLNGDKDITQEFQAAIDSGVETIFIPPGWGNGIASDTWITTSTIILRGNVKQIIGLGNSMIIEKPGAGKPAYRIEDGNSDIVIFGNFYSNYGTNFNYKYEHASLRTLVLKVGSGSYHNVIDGCKLFVEDVVGDPWVFNNMTAWIRDINTETYDFTHVTNNNSRVWTLGHKTEKDRTVYHTLNGGQTELLGGLLYKNNEQAPFPAFIIDESEASLSYRAKGVPYTVHVEEIHNGINRKLTASRTHRGRIALFAGYRGDAPYEPTDIAANPVSDTAIEITWTDNSDNEEGFIIERSLTTSGFETITTTESNATSFTDTGLQSQTKYYYRVLAVNQVTDSWTEYIQTANATTLTTILATFSPDEKPLNIYPNPSQNYIQLQLPVHHAGLKKIEIIDISGRILITRFDSGTDISVDVSELERGNYLIKVTSDDSTSVSRFIRN